MSEQKKRIAIVPGSFDPFTNGHLDIVREAAEIFDKVYVCCSVNSKKQRKYPMDKMRDAIEACLWREGIKNATATTSHVLTAYQASLFDAQYLIRGLRNTSDYLYEEEIAKFNRMINPDLQTIYIRSINEQISSSAIRELAHFGIPVSKYVPEEVEELMKRCVWDE